MPNQTDLIILAAQTIQTYEDYTNCLIEELREVIPIASVHGWKSSRFEEGQKFRRKLKELASKMENDSKTENLANPSSTN